MIVTRGASYDGSLMVTHSDDNELSDQRFIFVPRRKNKKGAKRGVVAGTDCTWPRLVSDERGPGYKMPGHALTPLIGHIPEVDQTYAYFDGNYGIMNEHNLMMGECTNGAKYQPNFVTEAQSKKTKQHIRYFYSAELSRIALERCKTAREAVKLMGKLIDTYGYFSTGETLLVGDEDEAWVFEMCALPDEKYHSAWVAQRVPDGDMFVAANEFRIRNLVLNDPDNFQFSPLLLPGVIKIGWAPPGTTSVDWLKTVSNGEYNHPYYSLRRVWRVMDRVNPDMCLSPWAADGYTTQYPFSIKPKNKLKQTDVFALYRDHYEGTQFDLTKGVAAGPYGNPNRYFGTYDGNQNNVTVGQKPYGAWERPLSVYYQGYTYVAQTQKNSKDLLKGIVWFGPDVSYTTCFAPFPSTILNLPESYQTGSPQTFDRAIAWWAFDFVANWARLNFQRMTQVDILPLQRELEAMQLQVVEQWKKQFDKAGKQNEEQLTKLCIANAQSVVKRWWSLADMLIAKYSDGYLNNPGTDGVVSIGYPADWLGKTDYSDGPVSYDMKMKKGMLAYL
ncbi:MAG: dipeptidase [Flavobacteriales bacterium]